MCYIKATLFTCTCNTVLYCNSKVKCAYEFLKTKCDEAAAKEIVAIGVSLNAFDGSSQCDLGLYIHVQIVVFVKAI